MPRSAGFVVTRRAFTVAGHRLRASARLRVAGLAIVLGVSSVEGVGAQPQAAPPAAAASPAGVRFMQGMLLHHAQALEMAALIDGRSDDGQLARLGERIRVSQRDEIALMAAWLEERRQPVPDPSSPHAHHAHGPMAGMASPAEMTALAALRGTDFARRFLTLMIRHHEGALVMVQDVLGAVGGSDDGEIFRFASDIDADQRAEIRRMRAMLAALSDAAPATRRRP
ncbi:MAG: DUF305 domain-containing protein [Gemmatimonadaceae bacterium]|jgi:uncharacterized protein (DUF305 family)|nr:DUF305 domain-containing protein [Gemmatimonadaceae bacterium]